MGLAFVLVAAIFFWVRYHNEVATINREIAKANYCQSNADCKVVTGQCPFGCYIPVNNTQGDRIEGLVNAYQSSCTYSCLEYKGIDCVDNKCQVRP